MLHRLRRRESRAELRNTRTAAEQLAADRGELLRQVIGERDKAQHEVALLNNTVDRMLAVMIDEHRKRMALEERIARGVHVLLTDEAPS